KGNYHLSYGMVYLPEGKMKSREGTVVDADDILQEMHDTAKEQTLKLGKIDSFTESEANELYEMIGLGALKFFLLKVDPKKSILFNPEESIDFQGFTGPFVQYTHARIQSMLRKHGEIKYDIDKAEIGLLILLNKYTDILYESADEMNPALIANYAFEISKSFNRYYAKQPILAEKDINTRNLRIELCLKTALTLTKTMGLLGIALPDSM
ncbi:MAG TPA: arginine--tRNA ligase, partial [Bacteroidetes bacterium]|nr:arginine--tRNA ligase [Bacteroidota bacterium]